METTEENIESVTKSDILNLLSWDRQRETSELLGFIARREAELSLNDEAA